MGAVVRPGAHWTLPAEPSAVSELRHRATGFASTAGASDEVTQAIALAVSETVTNGVVHAYGGTDGQPGIGHGLAVVGALAQTLEIATGPDGRGTLVTMAFGSVPPATASPGLEMLCTLALETVADVSNVDLVHEGVLRRVAAEVAGDPALTDWLRAAVPPAKPGTATWLALREGGAHLVVHDPTVPPSPGGTGERLDLTWWIAVALGKPERTPGATWGLGGRAGRHPYLPRRSSASSPTPPAAISPSLRSEPCCAPTWRRPAGSSSPRSADGRRSQVPEAKLESGRTS